MFGLVAARLGRGPLTVWFEAAWLMMTPKNGTSAMNLQRVLGIGSYQMAWRCCTATET